MGKPEVTKPLSTDPELLANEFTWRDMAYKLHGGACPQRVWLEVVNDSIVQIMNDDQVLKHRFITQSRNDQKTSRYGPDDNDAPLIPDEPSSFHHHRNSAIKRDSMIQSKSAAKLEKLQRTVSIMEAEQRRRKLGRK